MSRICGRSGVLHTDSKDCNQTDRSLETAEKAGLQISFEKTQYMNVDAKDTTWTMRTK